MCELVSVSANQQVRRSDRRCGRGQAWSVIAEAESFPQERTRRCEILSAEAKSPELSGIRTCDGFSAHAMKGSQKCFRYAEMGNFEGLFHNPLLDLESSV